MTTRMLDARDVHSALCRTLPKARVDKVLHDIEVARMDRLIEESREEIDRMIEAAKGLTGPAWLRVQGMITVAFRKHRELIDWRLTGIGQELQEWEP